ncbi:MAG TPA: Ig-like domain repeat protein [Lachnospiraceae bacterium]|nr:Ig-like domain repeat protein [Lachnospiraceae bacterium]
MNKLGVWCVVTVLCFALGSELKPISVGFEGNEETQEQNVYTNTGVEFYLPTEETQGCSYEYAVKYEPEGEYDEWVLVSKESNAVSMNKACQVKFRQTISGDGIVKERAYRICSDDVQPEIVLTAKTSIGEIAIGPTEEQWQKEDISCHVQVTDAGYGLKKIECLGPNEVLWQESYSDTEQKMSADIDFMLTNETPADGTAFEIKATDRAGNECVYQGTYFLDKQAPIVSVNGIENGKRYDRIQNLQITGQEAIWQHANICIDITRRLGDAVQFSERACLPFHAVESLFERNFTEEGDYTVQIYAYDKAGNQSTPLSLSFRVDLVAPQISLSGIEQGGRYCVERALCIEVEEAFYADNQVLITARKSVPGKEETYVIGEWKNQDIKSELQHVFREDGSYTVSVTAQDAAGHKTVAKTLHFMIDRTAPVLLITGVTEGSVRRGTVPILFSVQELFYDTLVTKLAITCQNSEGAFSQVVVPTFVGSGYLSEVTHIMTGEGKYYMNMQTIDAGGNLTEVSRNFAIDDTPPVIGYLDTIDQTYQTGFQLPKNFINEIKDMSLFSYYIYMNGELFDENTKVTEPGNYVIRVEATDEAGNTAVQSAKFIIKEEAVSILSGKLPLGSTQMNPEETEQSKIKEKTVRNTDGKNDAKSVSAEEKQSDAQKEKIVYRKKFAILLAVGAFILLAGAFALFRHIDRKSAI